MADEDVVRIYGQRRDSEVFFKMAKQHLKLAKEIQCRDFDVLIPHTTPAVCWLVKEQIGDSLNPIPRVES